jgi:hypothetical protein
MVDSNYILEYWFIIFIIVVVVAVVVWGEEEEVEKHSFAVPICSFTQPWSLTHTVSLSV